MSVSTPVNHPILPFNPEDLGLPGIGYGEFDLTGLADEKAPFRTSLISIEVGGESPLDEHAVRECWYIIRGTGILTYQGEEHTVKQKQLLFFESHHSHFVHNTGDEELLLLSIWWPREE